MRCTGVQILDAGCHLRKLRKRYVLAVQLSTLWTTVKRGSDLLLPSAFLQCAVRSITPERALSHLGALRWLWESLGGADSGVLR